MSTDKNVPEIRFKGFNGNFVKSYLGELIEIRSAARVHKEQWTETGIPFFRTSDVVSIYKGQENTKAYISREVYQGLSDKIGKLKKDDLLITGGGSIGIPYLVPNNDPLYFKDADLLWLKNNQKFDGYFLYTFFFSETFKKHIKSISHTGTIAHYTIEQAKATPINTCDDKEQKKIGNTFQKLDSLINQHQQKHDKISSIKKAMLEKMFPRQGETTPEIRFKGFSGDWEEKELGGVCQFMKGQALSWKDIDKDGKFACILYGHLYTTYGMATSEINYFTNNNSINIPRSSYGDVLIPGSDTTPTGIARATCVELDGVLLGGDINILRPSKNVNGKYLSYCINANRNKLIKLIKGTSVKHLVNSDIASINLTIPTNTEEQKKIGNYFQKLDALINQQQQQITKLNNIKQACLSKMFV
jgi:type I restriction enzyme, S subunit